MFDQARDFDDESRNKKAYVESHPRMDESHRVNKHGIYEGRKKRKPAEKRTVPRKRTPQFYVI